MSRKWCTRTAQMRIVSNNGSPCYGKLASIPSRRLILVDIENYCGKGILCPEDIRTAKEEINRELALLKDDLVVIGTSHGNNCFVCGTEWKGPRQVMRRGHNGADIALIDASRDYRLETFSSVIIVSGDGIFTDLASSARAGRNKVMVVSGNGHLNFKLRLAASEVKHIHPHIYPAA